MPVPSGIIFAWPSSNATIPAGWSRSTSLDGKYPHVAIGNTAGNTGGSANHSHASSANHGHTLYAHTHAVSAAAGTEGQQRSNVSGIAPATTVHSHGSSTSASATDAITARSVTSDVSSNILPSMVVIWMASDGTADIPAGAYAYFDSATLPTGWTAPTGLYSPAGLFLWGAPDGLDGGTWINGGYTTHVHTDPHNHTSNGHLHARTASAANTGTATNQVNLTTDGYARDGHTHGVELSSTALTLGNGVESLSAEDAFPEWEKLLCIENATGGADTPAGVIGLWLGAIANIPAGWQRKTSTQDFLWCAADATEIGNTGGTEVHTHDNLLHGHGLSAHRHLQISADAATTVCYSAAGTGATRSISGHVHTWTIGNSTDNGVSNETISWSNCAAKAAYPAYAEVLLVKKLPVTTQFPFCAHAGI
jgi:hypothetical protein